MGYNIIWYGEYLLNSIYEKLGCPVTELQAALYLGT